MIAVIIGSVLAVAGLVYVLLPLLVSPRPAVDLPTAEPAVGAPSDDALEAMIRHYRSHPRSCPACGPRPEPDALYCSSCGRRISSA